MTEAERHKLLVEWNNTSTDYPTDKCVHELFEEQVEKTPEAVAVIFRDEELTYRELNRKANQLAHYLKRRRVCPGTYVGVYIDRSVEAVIALLAVFKTGGVYVPLDPAYPKDRLLYMVKDSKTGILVTDKKYLASFPGHDVLTVCLERERKDIDGESADNPVSGVSADHIAYVIYTSGSTGVPKGVLIRQGAIAGHCVTIAGHYGLCPDDRIYQFASMSFDGAMEQILPALIKGAAVVPRDNAVWSPLDFSEKVSHAGLTILCLPPAVLHEWAQFLVEFPAHEPVHQPRMIICGGEELRPWTVGLLKATSMGSLRVLNVYGPTEATITATLFEIDLRSQGSSLPQRIPIGRPSPNRTVYILDKRGRVLPVGVPGEIHIGGDFLSNGYLNRPDMTGEKFIPDPFSSKPGARLYKTGDLGRYLSDGNIEFLGRIDDQVKIRGFRIEPGEIEAALMQHSAIQETVVVAGENQDGIKHLIAYVVLREKDVCTNSGIRKFLSERLPGHMIPSFFVILDKLPITVNGKVDRRALPPPDRTRPELDEAYVAPRNQIEERLADIWADVLGVDRTGIHDNFFDLGGDSLSVIRIIARIQDSFRVELSPATLFTAPTVAGLAHHVCSEEAQPPVLKLPPVLPRSGSGAVPLSYGQQEIWFSSRLRPDIPLYNETFTIFMKGPIDSLSLEMGLNRFIQRHETLRTAFVTEEGKPVQLIRERVSLELPVHDVRTMPLDDRESEALRRASAMARIPFDCSNPPLIRAMLVRLDDSDNRLYMVFHHLVVDGISISQILVPEMWTHYTAVLKEQPSSLHELAVHYSDYTEWQQKYLKGPVLEEQLAYWRKQLDRLCPLDLPTDRPRPPVQTFRGAWRPLEISEELTQRLKALGRREGCTLYMVLLAAFKVLLCRYSGQDDISVGTPEAGRARPELEPLVGYFLNMLVIRSNLSGDPSFREFLYQVRQVSLDAFVHKDLPFIKIMEDLKPVRDPARHPVFQVAFVMEPTFPAQESGWTVSQLEVQTGTAKFDLTLELDEREQHIIGRFEYNTDLFDESTIGRMSGHYEKILEGIVANPDLRLSELPLLTDPERHQLLVAWNDATTKYPRDKCIHQLFEEQVERTPDAAAVIFEERQLTYGELNSRANQLAHYLRKHGVGPDTLVGICVERSLEMVIAILGILKAGGAYVPLDPAYPEERLAFMLDDMQAEILISESGRRGKLPTKSIRTIFMDDDREVISQYGTENPSGDGNPDTLAYVIYTSGSTGKPKGVMVTHDNVVRLFEATRPWFHFSDEDVWTLFHSYAFDFSVWELWGALLHGGRLVVVPFWVSRSPDRFIDLLVGQRVTVLNMTPSAFCQLIQEERSAFINGGDRSLRLVIFGGEALQMNILKPWYERHEDRSPQLVNMYGITETTVHVTYQPLKSSDAQGSSRSLIGRPIPDLRVYILDQHLQPVPVGIPGEMYVGGAGLARGYLNRPQLTSERFIADPFSQKDGSRLYRTGDLARYLPDGTIEFLGRTDDQVKIRGFRIETGEIEAILGQHIDVREVVVIAREDQPGDKVLVAYVVLCQESKTAMGELRAFLKEKLPDYMIPSAFVVLDSLPLTSNGKLDRKALPRPEPGHHNCKNPVVRPRTHLEELLTDTWSEVLGIKEIGVYDNFFELGGHSLVATQVLSRIHKALALDVPLRFLFEAPTPAGLAIRIIQHQAEVEDHKELDRLLTALEGSGSGSEGIESTRDE
ncbi:MAG: amino acid adenylation domain-containing protein [Nitrospiraceae bacterium]|nr:MAG: amino acid adenylation domain-containing protein [Nitrospiraceae bacterium]